MIKNKNKQQCDILTLFAKSNCGERKIKFAKIICLLKVQPKTTIMSTY